MRARELRRLQASVGRLKDPSQSREALIRLGAKFCDCGHALTVFKTKEGTFYDLCSWCLAQANKESCERES